MAIARRCDPLRASRQSPFHCVTRRCAVVVLLTGASGFIGSRIAQALVLAGHDVLCAMRSARTLPAPGCRFIHADFAHDHSAETWRERLLGVDVVVNAVGILREHGSQTFEALHFRAPSALFQACVQAGVARVVHVSALGADAGARSGYHLSKRAADEFLLSLPLSAVVVQPSLVYGHGGASARLFTMLASLPLIALPGRGAQQVQPVHVDDAVQAIAELVERDAFRGQRIPLVGPTAITLREFLGTLRQSMGFPRACFVPVPLPLVRVAARVAALAPRSLFDAESLDMLERGNAAPAAATQMLLGYVPRSAAEFIEPRDIEGARALALLAWLLPLLRWSVATVWIVTGIVSLGVYPVDESYALLARVGIVGAMAPWALYGAALLDLALGAATLFLKRGRRPLWLMQIGLILGYTALITVWLPEYWLHPYGPVLKNLPMLAAIWMLYAFERK